MWLTGSFLFWSCFVVYFCDCRKIPDYVKLCKRNDPNLEQCYIDNFNLIVPKLNQNLRELNLRQVDPFHIDQINLNFGGGRSLAFDANLKDLVLNGLINMKCKNATIDWNSKTSYFQTYTPRLTMKSKYTAKGKILLVQFDSNGEFTGEFDGILATVSAKGKEFQKKGKTHYQWNDHTVDVEMKSIKMYFENILPRKDINDNLNAAINDNIQELYGELKPIINQVIKAIVEEQVNNVYNTFPIDVLYPI